MMKFERGNFKFEFDEKRFAEPTLLNAVFWGSLAFILLLLTIGVIYVIAMTVYTFFGVGGVFAAYIFAVFVGAAYAILKSD